MYHRSVKGQSMLFVVIGIAVIILVGIFLALTYSDTIVSIFSSLTLGKDAAKAQLAAEGCLQDSAREGLELVEAQGGYIRPSNTLSIGEIPLGYISLEGLQVRSLEEIEEDIAQYTEQVLPECFAEGFEKYTVEQNIHSVSIHFEEKNMLVTTAWDIHFVDEEGKAAFDIDEVSTKVPSVFKVLFEEAEQLIDGAPSIDLPVQYYEVQNVSVQVTLKGNESIAYFSQGEEYFVIAYS